MSAIENLLTDWSRAELAGDGKALAELLHEEFLAVGPFGFLLDRGQWAGRFENGLEYGEFGFVPDGAVRRFGDTALVVGTQTQRGSHQGRPIDGSFRVTLVIAGAGDGGPAEPAVPGTPPRLAGVHLSLRTPPEQDR
ncbi:nuclear transport factor 2 family protein [Phaeacidiphilus oryzae]|uniref:nuclear transport factor 2 family protein n=1 Tax=Phaeacidiphilus oryzae TaxID=348818 RepID=UPI0006896754|nr:nuclear transport factor 2 family protein [Phaeacidiphilus oryzae]